AATPLLSGNVNNLILSSLALKVSNSFEHSVSLPSSMITNSLFSYVCSNTELMLFDKNAVVLYTGMITEILSILTPLHIVEISFMLVYVTSTYFYSLLSRKLVYYTYRMYIENGNFTF